jgi:hypothetical protein
VIGKQVWNQLRWHPDLIDTVKFTQRGVLMRRWSPRCSASTAC